MLIALFQKGGILMIPLLGCSLISLTFIVERCFFWFWHHRNRSTSEIESILRHLNLNTTITYKETQSKLSSHSDYILRIYREALKHPENIKSTLDLETTKELGRMRKYHSVLDTIITLSPMIGILGTIVGIIMSFEFLGSSQLQDPNKGEYHIW